MFLYRLFFLFILLPAIPLDAQQLLPEYFARFTTAQGLTHNTITGLTQDATGYVWISTPSGLNRFNGSQFVQFHSNSDARSLASEDLTGLTWVGKNELGIYNTGLHIINTKTSVQRNIFVPYYRKQYQYKFNMVESAVGDEDGNIYVLSRSGFYHFDKRDSLVSRFDYYSEQQVPVEHFFFGKELLQLDKQQLLIVSINGLYVYDKRSRKIKRMDPKEYPLFADFIDYPSVYCWILQNKPGCFLVLKSLTDTLVYIDYAANKKRISKLPFKQIKYELHWRSKVFPLNDTSFYITGHNSGFFKATLRPSTGTITLSPKYFGNQLCTALLLDRTGNLWVGTNKGLLHQQNRAVIETARIPADLEEAFPNISMHKVFVDNDNVYVGTSSRGHLLEYDKKDLRFLGKIKFANERKRLAAGQNFNVYSIAKIDSQKLLLATDGPPLVVDKPSETASALRLPDWTESNWASDVFTDSRNITWISSIRVYRYNHQQKKADYIAGEVQAKSGIELPEVIREDADGNIWMAGHGLSRYNVKLNVFDVRVDSFPFIKMPDKQVNVMVIDKRNNTIWANSHNNGLIGYDIRTRKFRHFTTDQGLPANNISALHIVGNKLWIAAASGIACLDLHSFTIRGFGKEDGFPDMPVMNRANFFYDSAAQQLYIPFAKEIVRFNPFQLVRKGAPPAVFIESMVINNQSTIFHPEARQETAWNKTELHLTIGTIDFHDPGSLRYDYRIIKEGESPWISLGSQPSFNISSLAPGNYRIEVKVYSATNDWPAQVKTMQLQVTPPFWLRPWFFVVMGVLILLSIYALVQWRTRLARRKEMVNTQIEKLKANEYKAQFELAQISHYFSSSLAGKEPKTKCCGTWQKT